MVIDTITRQREHSQVKKTLWGEEKIQTMLLSAPATLFLTRQSSKGNKTLTSPVFLFFRGSVQRPRTPMTLSKCSLCRPAKQESEGMGKSERCPHALGEERSEGLFHPKQAPCIFLVQQSTLVGAQREYVWTWSVPSPFPLESRNCKL